MSLHTELPIYKTAFDLLSAATILTRGMPRDVKPTVGRRVYDDCLGIIALIARANQAQDKAPAISGILERTQSVEVQFRMARDCRLIATSGYARAVALTQALGRQASGWKKYATAPVAGASRRPGPSER